MVAASKDKMRRILKSIKRGDILITEEGKVIGKSEAKGTATYQRRTREVLLLMLLRAPSKSSLNFVLLRMELTRIWR